MGIRFFQSFVKTLKADKQIYIVDEIEKWKQRNEGDDAIIVIDLKNLSYSIITDFEDTLCGGRYQLIKYYEHFFNILNNLGRVKLVFFVDGPKQNLKNDMYIKRNDQYYKEDIQTIDNIKNGKTLKELKKKYFQSISVCYDLIQIAENNGVIISAIHRDCDIEAAEYATTNNALAIISDDTDFYIFKGNWKLWSAGKLNIDKLTTIENNKNVIRKYLRLTEDQMPLFATLSGNDIIPSDSVKRFPSNITKFILISNFINTIIPVEQWNEDQYKDICKYIFNEQSPEIIERVKESINSYKYTGEIYKLQTDRLLNLFVNKPNTNNYNIIADFKICVSLFMIDLRNSAYENIPELHVKLIKKQMGILLQHKNDNKITRKINLKRTHTTQLVDEISYPDYPNIKIPDLISLHNDKLTTYDKIKYELLCWIVSDKLNSNDINSIDEIYLTPVLTLTYLVVNKIITEEEADVFLYVVYAFENNLIPKELKHPQILDERAFQIVFIYSNMLNSMQKCIASVGFMRKILKPRNFDGVFFHQQYKKIIFMSEFERKNLLSKIIDVCAYKKV